MRSALVQWLERHGLPGVLAPDYAVMVALAALLGAMVFLRLARHDDADVPLEGRAFVAAYIGALAGGYVFEGLRAVPQALSMGSLSPIFHAGRAAYGGLLGGILGAAIVLRRGGASLLPFLDRTVPLLGITYAFVRTGCFLAGCDYGLPTASLLGVRFPAGSPAAIDHAALGWIPAGTASLPVHPTQLYEAAIGALASVIAAFWLIRGHRDGRAFTTWLSVYAIGRFCIEFLRGDGSRGVYAGLSTSQLVSLFLLIALALSVLRARRRFARLAPAFVTLIVLACAACPAAAQPAAKPPPAELPPAALPPAEPPPAEPPPSAAGEAEEDEQKSAPAPKTTPTPPPGYTPAPAQVRVYTNPTPYPPQGAYPYPYPPQGAYPYPYPPQGAYPYPYPRQTAYPYPPPAAVPPPPPVEIRPKHDDQADFNARRLGFSLGMSAFIVPGRFEVRDGGSLDFGAVVRFPQSKKNRLELGLELRGIRTADVEQYAIGVPMRFVFGLGANFEMDLSATPGFYNIVFDSPFFENVGAFGARFAWGMAFPIGSHVSIGLSPLGLLLLGSNNVRLITAFEPKFGITAAFF